jgi:hypothetical protein
MAVRDDEPGAAFVWECADCGYVYGSSACANERDEDDPYPDRVMVDAQGRPHYEP